MVRDEPVDGLLTVEGHCCSRVSRPESAHRGDTINGAIHPVEDRQGPRQPAIAQTAQFEFHRVNGDAPGLGSGVAMRAESLVQ